jgi:uncharacterized membrane protein YgdD (TMEM256/DUF423 family)
MTCNIQDSKIQRTQLENKFRDSSTSLGMTYFVVMAVPFFRIAAALCFLAVALGAFGAHSLKQTLETHGMLDVWNKAVLYHFVHAVALLMLALYGAANRSAWWLLFAGILIFSGSLYVMALTNLRWLGAITPIGGLCFLAGWAWLVIAPTK